MRMNTDCDADVCGRGSSLLSHVQPFEAIGLLGCSLKVMEALQVQLDWLFLLANKETQF